MAFKTKVLGREALMRKLERITPGVTEAAAEAKLEVAQEAAKRIAAVAPVGVSGDYKASIKGARQADNPGITPVGGQQSKDPDATAVYADYIWRFLEFGTAPHINGGLFPGTAHPGTIRQPHVFPTWKSYRKNAKAKISRAISKAVKTSLGK
ncbi:MULTISPECIES: HK97 gp10 family phage protein [unclassified Mesorhizobium]|uniref:HK97 gp10 family phage protein n=1 Tax=unclassified Mesorhizobium TaxID=325217 RepID=UPI0030150583